MEADRTRGREATEVVILAAARDVLGEQGFGGFGINAVARRAGCDKQLIYRYFGGLEGLVDQIAASLTEWVAEALAPLDALGRPESYAELVERLLLGYLQALRDDPVMLRIVAWEIADPAPMVRRLAAVRSRGLGAWIARQRGDLVPPEAVDAPAVNALLIAAAQQMALAGSLSGSFAGLPLGTDDDWQRLRSAIKHLVRRAYRAS